MNLGETKKNIHYWFVESESNPATDPLVFWTNGGPGCSGLIGFLTEQGPFRPDVDGQLKMNEWRWNKIANMVFLEQPVGVGFSYSEDTSDYKIGDDQAAKDNLQTIIEFLNFLKENKENRSKIIWRKKPRIEHATYVSKDVLMDPDLVPISLLELYTVNSRFCLE